MNNPPIKMIWKEPSWTKGKEVLVYDFIHDNFESFLSFALCWVPSSDAWLTISLAHLTPYFEKKILTEGN